MPTTIFGTTGVSQCDTNSVASADIQDGAVTAAKLATLVNPLGVGQTWQANGAGITRAKDTTYTNSTGRPIFVHIGWTVAAGGGEFRVNGTAIMTTFGQTTGTFALPIGNGDNYGAFQTGGAFNPNTWVELR